ncbi:MAG: MFS transporter [Anaerolineales bacterium]|nr:MFS transporter [Anaerolineales bacterium]
MDTHSKPSHPLLHVFTIRDFLLLWSGGTISMLGSQFSLIAMPWLVLQLTNDPLALGAILALQGIPRVAFMLIGGAISDRFSPRVILLTCDWINFVLVGLSAMLVFTGMIQVWMLYLFGLFTGLLSGFVIPAANSIVPLIVPEHDLQAGNSISMGSSQLVGLVGPALAGVVVGIYAQSTRGIAIALAIDAVTFAVSALALWAMRGGRRPRPAGATTDAGQEDLWRSISIGLRHLVNQDGLRFMFIVMTVVNFLFTGPLLVGIPVLADQRLPEGAQAFGFLMSAYSGGNLLGYALAGALPRPNGRTLSASIIGLLITFGLVLCAFGWITQTWVDFSLLLLLGTGNGYISLVIFTWIQQRTPKEMLGRMMSMLLFAGNGLVPFSMILTGLLLKNWTLTGLFALAGGLILLTTVWAVLQPALMTLSHEVVASPAD